MCMSDAPGFAAAAWRMPLALLALVASEASVQGSHRTVTNRETPFHQLSLPSPGWREQTELTSLSMREDY